MSDTIEEQVRLVLWPQLDPERIRSSRTDRLAIVARDTIARIAALVRREVERARSDERAVSRRAATEIHQDAVRRWCEQHGVDFPVLLLKISEHDERCAAIRARGEQHGTGEGGGGR